MANSKYTSGVYESKVSDVSRKSVYYDVEFYLPDEIRDRLPLEQSSTIHGIFLMGFYVDPQIDHTIVYGGCEWKITSIEHFPVRKGARGGRQVSRVVTEFERAIDDAKTD